MQMERKTEAPLPLPLPWLKSSKQVVLVAYANDGFITSQHLNVVNSQVDISPVLVQAQQDVIAVKNLWVSVDPYLRLCMKQKYPGLEPFKLHQPIVSACISRVIASANPEFKEGDIVAGFCDVSDYALLPVAGLQKIDTDHSVSFSDYLYVLGVSGLTAWGGLKIGDPKPGEQVFVSAAAGSVGILVGQLAKIKGCRVVGSTSTNEKVKILKEELDFDDAFNYKSETDWDATLSRCFPNGIDVYFENVGGRMLEAVLNHIYMNARIAVCGMISQYNKDWRQSYEVRNLFQLIPKSAKMEGFSVMNYMNQMTSFQEEMIGYMKQGKLKYKKHVIQGIDNFLDAFNTMFNGGNLGKVLLHLGD